MTKHMLFASIMIVMTGPANAACLQELTNKLKYSTRHACLEIAPGGMKITFTDRFYHRGPVHQMVQEGSDDRVIAFAMCAQLIFSLPKKDRSKPTTLAAKFDRDSYTSTCSYLFPVK